MTGWARARGRERLGGAPRADLGDGRVARCAARPMVRPGARGRTPQPRVRGRARADTAGRAPPVCAESALTSRVRCLEGGRGSGWKGEVWETWQVWPQTGYHPVVWPMADVVAKGGIGRLR
eukprot:1968723-Prymnesium_polylepis.1